MKQQIATYVVTNNDTFICIWKLNDPFGFIESIKKGTRHLYQPLNQ